MAKLIKRKRYDNRQTRYTDRFTIAYWLNEKTGYYKIHAEDRPHDPIRNHVEAHVALDGTEVCVRTGREPRTLEAAEAIAHAWMVKYSEYIRTGKCPKGSVRVDV